jgi:hypothetical protein
MAELHLLAYPYMNFHRMAIFFGIAVVILIVIARLLLGRL